MSIGHCGDKHTQYSRRKRKKSDFVMNGVQIESKWSRTLDRLTLFSKFPSPPVIPSLLLSFSLLDDFHNLIVDYDSIIEVTI